MLLIGPGAWVNGLLSALILPLFTSSDLTASFPTVPAAALSFLLMQLVGDFGLYWGHRIQHTIPYLWEHVHSVHHAVQTPTPLSTIYLHPIDATLQGSLPLLLAAVVVRPHPVMFYIYVFLRISENCMNHSGLQGPVVDFLTLKFLPFRCDIKHHDYHHANCRGGKTKNYGEIFWIWDYMFGSAIPSNVKSR
jgi:sterol desaturase/sphingolipid hydroxylase (fatty acid hydroxylase superfamily)